MKPEDFIYKNIAAQLTDKYPKARQGLIAKLAGKAKGDFKAGGNFKGKAFDTLLKEAEKILRQQIKMKL